MNSIVNDMAAKGIITPDNRDAWRWAQKFIQYCRVCSICGKNEYDFAVGGHSSSNSGGGDWMNCETCKFGWCCSKEHWEEYKDRHTAEICYKYRSSIMISRFEWKQVQAEDEAFCFTPEETLAKPMETFPEDGWESYFKIRCPDMYAYSRNGMLPPEFLPASTHALSQPVTCLYGMYQHSIERFNSLPKLSVHVVGASTSYELPATCIWEEILHCLPAIKKIQIDFVGPEARSILNSDEDKYAVTEMEVCPTCESNHRQRSISIHGQTYHEFVRTSGDKFSRPDLIVAFNTGMHEDDTESWTESLRGILDMNVPALFTSYNRGEADQDFQILRNLNANLLLDEPVRNPMAAVKPEIECTGDLQSGSSFFHTNMYCILFQGFRTSD